MAMAFRQKMPLKNLINLELFLFQSLHQADGGYSYDLGYRAYMLVNFRCQYSLFIRTTYLHSCTVVY